MIFGKSSLIGLVILILDIVAIIEIVKSGMSTEKKILWVLIILVLPLIGLILYYFLGRGGNSVLPKA